MALSVSTRLSLTHDKERIGISNPKDNLCIYALKNINNLSDIFQVINC
jgi:hypothetical protein